MSAAALGRRTRAFAWSVLAGVAWFWIAVADALMWLAGVIEGAAVEARTECLRRARL